MTAPVFVDTNVLIYALDEADRKKQQAAVAWKTELWKSRRGRTSFQVLQEFYAKSVQKWPSSRNTTRAEVRDLLAWRPVAVDAGVLHQAWQIQDRYQFTFWDSLIVAAAKAASCGYLLTEDLQHGQDLDGLIVLSPFRQNPFS